MKKKGFFSFFLLEPEIVIFDGEKGDRFANTGVNLNFTCFAKASPEDLGLKWWHDDEVCPFYLSLH
jgi:hypothetical protein